MSQSIGGFRLPAEHRERLLRPRPSSGQPGSRDDKSIMQQSIDRLFATRGSVAPSSLVEPNPSELPAHTSTPTAANTLMHESSMLRSIPEVNKQSADFNSMSTSVLTENDCAAASGE